MVMNRTRCGWLASGLAVMWSVPGGALAEGGTLRGRVLDAGTGKGIRRVLLRAFAHGQSVSKGALTEGDGGYVLTDLPAGPYAVCVSPGDAYRPVSMSIVEVVDGQTTEVDLRANRSLEIQGDAWTQTYPVFHQSFTATGLALTRVGIKAFGDARPIRLQVRAGDGPDGELIGPARTTASVGHEGKAVARWSGGEIPTVPGQVYTVEMAAPEGQKWVTGVAGRGDVYPSGSAYFGGSPRPYSDLGLLLCEDNDNVRTDYAVGGGWRTYRARSMGQTFVALSDSITFASAILSGVHGPPVYVRFSIHEGGPGGSQIGPSKGVQVSETSAVAWGPNEVPVTPGETYYLHVESFSGLRILIGAQPDCYADGTAVFEGKVDPTRDIGATVAGGISPEGFARLVRHPRCSEVVELANPSFEEGDSQWSLYQGDGAPGAVVGCDAGVVPRWGTKMYGWTDLKESENHRPTLYQQVRVVKGETYSFSGSVYTKPIGGRSSDVKIRLVVEPAGSLALRDYDQVTTSQWYATQGQWRRGSVEFTAQADVVTIGFEMEQRFKLERSSLYVDGAHLERLDAK